MSTPLKQNYKAYQYPLKQISNNCNVRLNKRNKPEAPDNSNQAAKRGSQLNSAAS